MPEPVAAWWARRQWSRGLDVPYATGMYREAWAPFPVLVRQYHPEFNGGILLTQIPPTAEVYLCWQCDAGHVFVATPAEQRSRPGRERRRSSWCPDCAAAANPRAPVLRPAPPAVEGVQTSRVAATTASVPAAATGRFAGPHPLSVRPPRPSTRAAARVCAKTPHLPPGEAFASQCAPKPASAVEAQLRFDLAARLEFEPGLTAVRLARPFFDHLEAWPDIVLSELRVAIEYDSTGRHGLEHVGKREEADRRKDRALRAAGWEVLRIRTGRLPALGPYDLQVAGLTKKTVGLVLDRLREVRGSLFVDAYLR
ncbi:zinc-ribbon domain-containing protein [Frondihabitans cladoniiphilus]